MSRKPIIVIGAGIGGLSAAIRLAATGRQVLVLEQNPQVGGKMGEVRRDGFRWDTGPSVITMRHVFDELFSTAGRRLDDYLNLEAVEPLTRYFFPDGIRLDVTRDLPRMLGQIRQLNERDVEGYLRFLAYAARLHRITGPVFIYNHPPKWRSLSRVSPADILAVDGLRSMHRAISSFVQSPHLRQVLGRFATYVGASPYLAPATLNVIAHVELNEGVWYPRGGVYRIAEAYAHLARELGVEIQTDSRVARLEVQNSRVVGVRLEDGRLIFANAVIANVDIAVLYEKLLAPQPNTQRLLAKIRRQPLSCSGFIILLGVEGGHPQLAHHNIFFSSDYRLEFEQIFTQDVPPSEPTIYVTITSRSTPEDAPPGCENWFVLVNIPALQATWDWGTQAEFYGNRVLDLLAARGFDVRDKLRAKIIITPLEIEQMSGAYKGALYGGSSNSRWAAFRRPHNRATDISGLYFAGGAVHPGGGVPLATLSGKVASQMLIEDGF